MLKPIIILKYKMFLKQFSQGLYVATAALTSIITLGYMMDDIHKTKIRQLTNKYEEQIKMLKIDESKKVNLN